MSVRSDKLSNWIVAGTLVAVVWAIGLMFMTLLAPQTTVRLGDGVFKSKLAVSATERARGLSGVSRLGSNEAMLLVFDYEDKWQIWMKDMKFSIDILWLDSDKRVVHIVKNASPDSYPEEKFEPNNPARYVLEIPAGSVDKWNIRIGSQAKFDLGAGPEDRT